MPFLITRIVAGLWYLICDCREHQVSVIPELNIRRSRQTLSVSKKLASRNTSNLHVWDCISWVFSQNDKLFVQRDNIREAVRSLRGLGLYCPLHPIQYGTEQEYRELQILSNHVLARSVLSAARYFTTKLKLKVITHRHHTIRQFPGKSLRILLQFHTQSYMRSLYKKSEVEFDIYNLTCAFHYQCPLNKTWSNEAARELLV